MCYNIKYVVMRGEFIQGMKKNNNEIYKRALTLAVPLMIQNGITNAAGLIDSIMVGSLGTNAMTAVSIITQLFFVFSITVSGALAGPGIYTAQFYGKGDTVSLRDTFRIKHYIGLLCLIVGMSVFVFYGEPLIGRYLRGEGGDVNPAQTMKFAKEYLEIILWSMPAFVVTQIYDVTLRETSDSFKPMVSGLVSVGLDVLFNWILIYGKLGFPAYGVKGAAIATSVSRVVEMFVVVIWTHAKKYDHFYLYGAYRGFSVSWNLFVKIIKKTLPIFFNELIWAGSAAFLTQTYSIRGLNVVAALNISNTICNLLNVVFFALGNAVGILVGQTLGEGKKQEAKSESVKLMWFTGMVSAVLMFILLTIADCFPMLYDTTPQIRCLGGKFIAITALFFPVQGFLNAMYFTLRSGGRTFITFLFDSGYSCAVAIPMAVYLCNRTAMPILSIYTAVQAADIIKLMIGCILLKKDIWLKNLVK